MKKAMLLLLICLTGVQVSQAQDKPRFQEDVQTIKHYDQMYAPPANPILFVGSSSIRKWEDLERTFASYEVMNRGIGGAKVNDIIFYLDDIVFPYHPREIVLYVGENDIPDGVPADTVLARTKNLIAGIRAKLPETPITYISIKPSPSRDKYRQTVQESNTLIKEFLKTQHKITWVDVYTPMLTKEGNSRPEIFQSDMLHLNKDGYKIWKKLIQPTLIK
ncbi:GDSL-type esterase/lipase family protein [Chitinophaga sancti]|uniref:GDSL-type esterase/lipase family protein n=1 Tax=Chitinophaga sancti TaxID=1004 RepID=A0A1K1QXH4_9BACT|nr:GDSL-type esterase/lipase family protein [Chitinophaga sancti]WQD62031.1 GDSL-type esterase/lipase family protein [Chitinophaga sancti]WQG92400.1 GDSL-type esterase/lipase family protein [Chitinophaga sancti]SFW64377.1 Lysophospholipase L1 [Chitinophaga sancti]